MKRASYKDIDRWQDAGLIDQKTAISLRAELDSRPAMFSLATVLSVLAALLIGGAIITFVAANWQVMPRSLRVGVVCSTIFIGYGVGGWCFMRGYKILSESFFLIGAIGFGAGIALVGQMYHMSGNEMDALLLWCLGTMVAAFLLRSPSLAVLAGSLAACFAAFPENGLIFSATAENIALLLAAYRLCLWTRSRLARHVWMLHLVIVICRLSFWHDIGDSGQYYIAAAFAVLFLIDWLRPQWVDRLFHFSGPFGDWALIYAFAFLWLVQLSLFGRHSDALTMQKILLAAAIFLLCLIALWSSHTRGWNTRVIALFVFIAEVYFLIWKTIDTLLLQSAFFLVAAVVFFAMAHIALRHKRRQP